MKDNQNKALQEIRKKHSKEIRNLTKKYKKQCLEVAKDFERVKSALERILKEERNVFALYQFSSPTAPEETENKMKLWKQLNDLTVHQSVE